MKTTVAVEFKTEGLDAAGQSVGSFKKQLREAQADLVSMADKFGLASSQAQAAAMKVAGLKDSIGDAKALADTFNPDKKFVALGGALQGVTAGFSAYSGLMGVLGVKSEETEKLLLKVQSAMALQQGISGVMGALDSFKLLGKDILKTTAFQKMNTAATAVATGIQQMFGASVVGTGKAFNVLKGAIISTGIGALVVAIGFAIDKLNIFGDTTNDAADETDKLTAALNKQKDALDAAMTSNVAYVDRQRQMVKNTQKIADLQAMGAGNEKEIAKLRKENFDIDIINVNVELGTKEKVLSVQEKEILLTKKYTLEQSKNRIDIEATTKAKEKAASAAEKAASKAQNAAAKATQIAKQKAEDNKKAEDIRVEQTKNTDALIEENRLLAVKDAFIKSQLELANQQQKEIDAQIVFLNAKEINQTEYDKRALLINEKYKILQAGLLIEKEAKDKETTKATREKELTNLKAHSEAKLAEVLRVNAASEDDSPEAAMLKIENIAAAKLEAENAAYLIEKEQKAGQLGELALLEETHKNKLISIDKNAASEKKAIAQTLLEHKKSMQQADLDLIGKGITFLKDIAGKNKALQKAAIIAENALGIAKIITNTNASNSAAILKYSLIPGGQALSAAEIVRNKIGAGIGIVSTIAATAKALSAIGGGGGATSGGSVGGGSGGGGSAVTAPISPQAQVTNLSQSSINAVGNAANRAYVLETDVSNNQERIRRLNRASRIN